MQYGGYKTPFLVVGGMFIVSSLLICVFPRIHGKHQMKIYDSDSIL